MKNKKTVFSALCLLLFTVSACENPTANPADTVPKTSSTGTFRITYSNQLSEFMDKGSSRIFTADTDKKVGWTVTGNTKGSATAISSTGRLTVGANETSITLTVRAEVVGNPAEWGEYKVKVRGWHEITGRLEGVIQGSNALAYAEGVGSGRGRWVMAGWGTNSVPGDMYPVTCYSDDDGKTWVQDMRFRRTDKSQGSSIEFLTGYYPELALARSFIYDGPAGDKKFVMGTSRGNIFWSRDGITWTKVWSGYVIPSESGGHSDPTGLNLDNVVYGVVDTGAGIEGRYLVTGLPYGSYAWSRDAETWTQAERQYAYKRSNTITLSQAMPIRWRTIRLRYGTGKVGGVPTNMFFAHWTAPRPPGMGVPQEVDLNLYSTDSINWTTLADANPEEIWYFNEDHSIWYWMGRDANMALDSSVLAMDRDALAALDFQSRPLSGYRVMVDTKGETLFAGDDEYSKQVNFAVVGGGYIMAVGEGRRLAIAHEGAYTVTAE
jgi:hypothetical protein